MVVFVCSFFSIFAPLHITLYSLMIKSNYYLDLRLFVTCLKSNVVIGMQIKDIISQRTDVAGHVKKVIS